MRIDLHFFKVLKVPTLLASVFIIAALIYYFVWVRNQTTYLMNRNFRLLTTIGQQIEGAIVSQAKIIEGPIQDQRINDKAKEELAKKRVPSLEVLERCCYSRGVFRPVTVDSQKIKEKGVWNFTPVWENNTTGIWLLVDYYFSTTLRPYYRARLNLNKILSGISRGEREETAFDTVLLAATDGTVIYQQGAPELRLMHLDKLTAADGDSGQKILQFNALSRSTNFINVNLSGANYSLFIQPCCDTIQVKDGNLTETQPIGKKAKGDQGHSQAVSDQSQSSFQRDRGWVVCGLVSHDRFRYSSFTLSFSILALITALMLLALFSWPFLKLSLLGAQQRVQMVDVLLVGFCGLLGLSLITILWLDFAVYDKLKGESENQLSNFANKIKVDLRNEVQGAYRQLRFLELRNSRVLTLLKQQRSVKDGLCVRRGDDHPYWEFFFANDKGQQIFKCSFSEEVPSPRILVEERQYFRDAKDSRTWPLPSRENFPSATDHGYDDGYVLESVRSWATGEMRAVISKPVYNHPGMVSALTIPIRPLIKSFTLPGFGFAIIDENGKVLFHTDAQRNSAENFFAEADWDHRLMAAISARVDEKIDIKYWGKAHSAYVTPLNTLPEVPWFLITFYDKQLHRTFNLVLLITTTLFLAAYLILYILTGLFIALFNPAYRATWLWPARTHTIHYYRLSLNFLTLFIIAIFVMLFLSETWLLLTAFILPFAAWLMAYLTLRRGDDAHQPTSPPLIIPYSLFAVSLLAIVAVWPTVAFFKTAYDLQMQTFVKYNQLKLARTLEEPSRHRYYDFFNDTKIVDRKDSGQPPPSQNPGSTSTQNSQSLLKSMFTVLLPRAMEDSQPHQPTLSAMLRELLCDSAADQSWHWQLVGNRAELLKNGGNKTVESTVPTLEGNPILLAIMTIAIVFLMFWIVRFVCRRIFVIDLVEPILPDFNGGLETATSYNIFLICNEEQKEKLFNRPNCIDLKQDYEQWAQDDDSEQGWRARLSDFLSGQTLNHNVFIDHFEYRLYDQTYNERKLALLEELVQVRHRTVVIFSGVSSSFIFKRHKHLASDFGMTAGAALESDERSRKLLSSFILIDAKYLLVEPELKVNGKPKDRRLSQRLRAGKNWLPSLAADPMKEAERRDPDLVYFAETLRPHANNENGQQTELDRDQIRAEIDDRAANYYRDLWDSCTDVEKMVLFHLANDGFVNGKNRKTIRRLMARRLIYKAPHFQLMSQAFRRFVLSAQCRSDISAGQDPPPSAWDMIRMPFLAILLAGVAFFFVTQKELFTSSVIVITGFTAALPALVKLISLVMGKSIQGTERE